jgi:hypothetical protein
MAANWADAMHWNALAALAALALIARLTWVCVTGIGPVVPPRVAPCLFAIAVGFGILRNVAR